METKPLLFGIIGFLLGGFVVSLAATTLSAPVAREDEKSTSQVAEALADKTGDEFDEAFISGMIGHHEGAVDMAKLSASNAKHEEIKKLSLDIIVAQEKEINQMKQWQADWGYSSTESEDHPTH